MQYNLINSNNHHYDISRKIGLIKICFHCDGIVSDLKNKYCFSILAGQNLLTTICYDCAQNFNDDKLSFMQTEI